MKFSTKLLNYYRDKKEQFIKWIYINTALKLMLNPIELTLYYLCLVYRKDSDPYIEELIREVMTYPTGHFVSEEYSTIRNKHLLETGQYALWLRKSSLFLNNSSFALLYGKLYNKLIQSKSQKLKIVFKGQNRNVSIEANYQLVLTYAIKAIIHNGLRNIEVDVDLLLGNRLNGVFKFLYKSALDHAIKLKVDWILQQERASRSKIRRPSSSLISNAFEVLGIAITKDFSIIKKQYRKLATKYHPDKNMHLSRLERNQLDEKMKSINTAYSVLEKHFN